MKTIDWLALYLWRDRGGYDPATGSMTEDYRRSLRTRFRAWRYTHAGWFGRSAYWLVPTLIALATAVAVGLFPYYLNPAKPDQQVQPDAGELLLRCTKEGDGVLRCRPVQGRKD